jgi:integrase
MASVRKRCWNTSKGEAKTAWAVDFVDQAGRRQRKQFQTKRAADAFRVDIEGKLASGTFRPNALKVTVQEACETFLRHCEGRKERGERMTRHNLAVYEGHIWNYICPNPERHEKRLPGRLRPFTDGIGSAKVGQLTQGTVGEFRDRLRDAGVSVPTTRKILGTLQLVLQHAVSSDVIAVNPARGIKVIGRRDEGSRKIVPPSKEAVRQLIKAADPDFRVKLIVASATGVRAGEFHALRWRHIDLEKREVTIEARVDAYGDEDVTKTAAGMRTIPLGTAVVQALRRWKMRSKRKKPNDLVFPNKRGTFESHDNMVKREFNPLFEKLAKLNEEDPAKHPKVERFNWHALRHFAISCWIDARLSPKTVQTFAGHSSLQVTMDRYGHLFPSEDHRRAMDGIANRLFAG